MPALKHDTDHRNVDALPQTTHPPPSPAQMPALKVLVVIDGTEQAGVVLRQAIALAAGREETELILLNVQPEPANGRLRGYGSFKRDEIEDRLVNELGRRALASAGRTLDLAGLKHRSRVEIGAPIETILRVAEEEDCDLMLVGDPEPGRAGRWLAKASGWLLGSIATALTRLAPIPVVVVKRGDAKRND